MKKTIIFLIFALVLVSAVSAGIGNYSGDFDTTGYVTTEYYNVKMTEGVVKDWFYTYLDSTFDVLGAGYMPQITNSSGTNLISDVITTTNCDVEDKGTHLNVNCSNTYAMNNYSFYPSYIKIESLAFAQPYWVYYSLAFYKGNSSAFNSTSKLSKVSGNTYVTTTDIVGLNWTVGDKYDYIFAVNWVSGVNAKLGYNVDAGSLNALMPYRTENIAGGTLLTQYFKVLPYNLSASSDERVLSQLSGFKNNLLLGDYVPVSYYFAQNGSDTTGDGSQTNPYKTITKLNSIKSSINPGDSVLFRRGDVWNTYLDAALDGISGNQYSNVTISSYGSLNDPFPVFDGSVNLSVDGNWTCAENICNTTANFSVDVGNMIFGEFPNEIIGDKEISYSQLDELYDFYFNSTRHKLSLYVGSYTPETLANNIRAGMGKNIMDFDDTSYMLMREFQMKYGGWSGADGSRASHVTFENFTLMHIGGGFQSGTTTMYGNGIQFYSNSTHNIVRFGYVEDVFDACLSNQFSSSSGGANESYIYFYDNVLVSCGYGIEYFNGNADSSTSVINYYSNTIVNPGSGLTKQRETTAGRCFRFSATNDETSQFNVRDNICINATNYNINLGAGSDTNWNAPFPTFNYNYYNQTSTYFSTWNGTEYSSFGSFKTATGQEANGVLGGSDIFINVSGRDFRPISTSIACTMSSTGSYVGALPCYDAPPDPVTNLGNVSVTNESIYINWTNPTDYGDLNNTYIYLNGNFVGNISKDEDGWTNYSLINNTAYRFDVITTDNTGNLGTNGTITITTLQNTYYPPESGIFPEIVNNGRYTINFTFLQKPYFLYLNITGNNTGNVPMEWQWTASSSVSDLTCSGNENDNNYATYCRPASGNTDEHHINKTFYNHANYTDRELHGTIYFQARYNSYVTAYCYGSSSYQSIGTYYGGSLGDYVTVYQNFTIPEACRDESTIKMKYVFKSTYGSGYSFYFNDAEIYTVAPYYIQFMGTTIFNSTNATDTSFEMNLTGHGNNITGNKFNITYGTAGLSTFNYNVSYGFLYNKSINISILNSATNTSLNPLCSFNGAVVYPSSAFIYYNSSLTNWLNCTLSGYASVSSYIYPTYNNLTLYMGAFDLNISIYDEQIDQLITNKSIYIYIIQGSYAANYSTSNGTLFLSALTMPTGSFEIRYGGLNDDYATRSYFVTLQNASSIELYTVLLNQSSLITFNVIDERGYPVTDAYLKVQRYFIADGAYKLVGMETIDDTGTAGMYLVPNTVPYIVYVEKDSEVVFLSTANKIFMDTIQIYASLLDNPLESFYKINQQLTSYLAYSNATKLLTYFWNDASGIVTTACLEVTYRGSTGIGTLTSSCTSAASGTIVLNMTGLMLNNTEYEAHGKVYTNTAYSEYITDFLVLYHAAGIYEALGKTGLFFSWFLIITMFFVGITIAFDVAVIYTALAMIVVTVIGSAWFSVGLIAAICLLGVLMAIASKRT